HACWPGARTTPVWMKRLLSNAIRDELRVSTTTSTAMTATSPTTAAAVARRLTPGPVIDSSDPEWSSRNPRARAKSRGGGNRSCRSCGGCEGRAVRGRGCLRARGPGEPATALEPRRAQAPTAVLVPDDVVDRRGEGIHRSGV